MANLLPFLLGSVVMWIYYILELIGMIVWAMMLVTNAYVSNTCDYGLHLECGYLLFQWRGTIVDKVSSSVNDKNSREDKYLSC